ncbi:AAA domain-containing protein [Amycolatopsis sp. WQ 127309]|uniref:AAA domain-containing protein n=1 Tax=Amycolatopsis sp. WQ 127309 TaxID=2932773 RepID=UPI001FF5C167|nr:AAA domain-containing protein [Amycolatopsis sp. WQ 127309]UOZ04800.1 AAA domain-containing protein [Amycolatopsis sp. WQ 127309]
MSTSLVDRARRLFEFLRGAQQLKASPVRSVDVYQREGDVVWVADVPVHPAVRTFRRDAAGVDTPMLSVERVLVVEPPEPEAELGRWLTEPLDDPEQPPSLRTRIVEVKPEAEDDRDADRDSVEEPAYLELEAFPEVRKRFSAWLPGWHRWAGQERVDRPARNLYARLYSIYVSATESPEELELVAGTGCLSWQPVDGLRIKRHLLTSAVSIDFDDRTGLLQVRPVESAEPLRLELDMVDPGLVTTPDKVNEVRADIKAYDGLALDPAATEDFARRLVHSLDPDGEYREQDESPAPGKHGVVAFAPALILRRRSHQGLIEIFDTILGQLDEAGEVPDGLIPLLDPDHVPTAPELAGDGAILTVDDEPFLPLPVNDRQLEVIRRVDTSAQTLVQGPPGTGKTHTAAALISHLLAQGKRVLVTAHTDRALREVRDKLPDEIKPLSVAVVGTSREDMADLKLAVQEIAAAASDHDGDENARAVRQHLEVVDRLSRDRAGAHSRLLQAREREVRAWEHGGYRGTLSAIAQRLDAEREKLSWLLDLTTVGPQDPAPVTSREAQEWHGYLLDERLRADEPQSRSRLLAVGAVPDAAEFARLIAVEHGAAAADQHNATLKEHAAFAAVRQLAPEQRGELQGRLHKLAGEADYLLSRREQWLDDALRDIRSGRSEQWRARGSTIAMLIETCTGWVARVGPLADVALRGGDAGALVALARELGKFLAAGGSIKTSADGSPKIGAFAHKTIKQAQPLFDSVRVDGLPPASVPQLETFIAWAEGSRVLTALDRAWPENVVIPAEDTLQERLQWHVMELTQLRRVLVLADDLAAEEQRLRWLKLPSPDWNDLNDVRRYASLAGAATTEEALVSANKPLVALERLVGESAQWSDAAHCVLDLFDAAKSRDREGYSGALRTLTRLGQVREQVNRREQLAAKLQTAAPELYQAIEADPHDAAWPEKLASFREAWNWSATRAWVAQQEAIDVNSVQLEISAIEQRIRDEVESVAARRAWDYAASPERLSGTARADLTQYAQLVQRAGKNTGLYRNQRRAEIRKAMDRCRPSVPVWIMPIYRIAEQLRVRPDMFDVVVVDEASQAGTEAVFLQYLARKIVVIGDDKQVSPSAVGVDQQQLRDLARQYLAADRYRDSWHDPRRSLFDEAKMRYGKLITLIEHRRCVPEIIGFSNRIAYEPDGIRLIPVRQYGADRLEPVKAVYLEDGYERGVTNKSNPVEVDAIVEQIEKCFADPAYDGKTFGVVSLLGPTQAKEIQNKLLGRIPKEEWQSRDLRCGDAADFQGSERDVIFLSMVAAPAPGKRMMALTQEQYVQRFNVAVSRAKDQVWVFHSVRQDELPNQECMRFQLLDYSYGVTGRRQNAGTGTSSEVVPEDRRVEPFDSLFEQRVYNRIVDRGYTVFPQYEALGYRIDLVVLGAHGRLAVECDGDQWHGPDAYERDLARQRDLERCGWRFFRIPGSAFDVDRAHALSGLWEMLRDEEIHPSGWVPLVEGAGTFVEAEPAPPEAVEPDVVSAQAWEWPAEEAPDGIVVDVETVVPVEEHLPVRSTEQGLDEPPAAVAQQSVSGVYSAFSGRLTAVAEASRDQLIEGIREIVAVEGPVLGERIHRLYVQSSGGIRVGPQLARALNSAVSLAIRRGVLLADDPLQRSGVRPRTYRLPDQPLVRVRDLGPRDLDDVPPRELATIMAELAGRQGWDDEEALFRAVLARLGLKKPTKHVRDVLSAVLRLARTLDSKARVLSTDS